MPKKDPISSNKQVHWNWASLPFVIWGLCITFCLWQTCQGMICLSLFDLRRYASICHSLSKISSIWVLTSNHHQGLSASQADHPVYHWEIYWVVIDCGCLRITFSVRTCPILHIAIRLFLLWEGFYQCQYRIMKIVPKRCFTLNNLSRPTCGVIISRYVVPFVYMGPWR